MYEPDIIVSSADGSNIALVVEAKSSIPDLRAASSQIKRYMIGMRCPVGVLVTPTKLWVFKDDYESRTEASVHLKGEYAAPPSLATSSAPPAERFEDDVQAWFESLASESARRSLPMDLRGAVEEYIVPALAAGEVRAARPRRTGRRAS